MKSLSIVVFIILLLVFSVDNIPAQVKKKPDNKTISSQHKKPDAVETDQTDSVKSTTAPSPIKPKPIETYLSSAMEQAILNEINTARKEPEKYVQYLEDYKKIFKGKTAYFPNYLRIETQEGAVPIEEAVEFMKTLPKLDAYGFSNGLNKSAAAQLGDLIENSSLGHTGKDGSNLQARLAKFGTPGGRSAENIAFYVDTARDVVLMMIVDDGVKARSHRKNIFGADFKVVGIAFGKGKSGEGLCVVQFAGGFSEAIQPKGVREM